MVHFVLHQSVYIAVDTVCTGIHAEWIQSWNYMLMLLNLHLTGDCQTIDAEAQTDLLLVVKYNQLMCSGILAYLSCYFVLLCVSYVHPVSQHLPTSELGLYTSFFHIFSLLIAIFVSEVMNE